MICSEFIRSVHIPMVFDDNSCSIEEYERQTICFNPISGINHLGQILRKINEFVLKIGEIPEEEVSYETVVPTFVR